MTLLAAASFYLTWWVCAYSGPSSPYLGLLAGMVTFLISQIAARSSVTLFRSLAVAAVGIALDFFAVSLGFFHFHEPGLPIWMVGLWLAFAGFILQSFSFFYNRWVITIFAGSLGGIANYSFAESLQILSFAGWETRTLYALAWGVIFPIQIWMLFGLGRKT